MSEAKRPISMRDIAEMAGVSVATVSRVINHNGRFSEETRQRVQKVIDENHYVTNMAARSLRQSQTKTIGMIVPDITYDFYSTLAFHSEQQLAREDYSVFVCNDVSDPSQERNYLRSLASKRVDGVICISGSNALNEGLLPKGTPVVCIDRYSISNFRVPRVISDEHHGGLIAARHLIDCGCRHIMLLGSFASTSNFFYREQGFLDALYEAGIYPDPGYCIRTSPTGATMEEARALVTKFLSLGLTLDGIVALSDIAAVGALSALKDAGIDVPGQVKIVGYDDTVYARLTSPTITSIHRYPEQMAAKGCQVLLDMLRDGTHYANPETVVPVSLIERESSKC